MSLSPEEINNRFGWHRATIEGENATKPVHDDLRHLFKEFASKLNDILPEGRYKSLTMTELENTSMWSHKSVAERASEEYPNEYPNE